ncbi:MAG: hypothetical protein LBO75_03015, partial [Bifidobacteriaceae bacterium]|nr:hypothetical protein [Bifidobacteriaceae bacterium]
MNQWAPALSSMLQQSVSLVAQHSLVELGLTKEAAALLKPAGDLLVTKCIDKVKERRTQADMVSELEAWVDTENISESDFAAGMATAKEVMQLPVDASGLSFAERLDSEQIAELYKEAAREKYPDWDKDQGFSTVASRAIDTVCSTIAKGLLGQETTYRAAILQIAAEVGTLLENLRQLAEQGQPPDLDSPAVNLAVRTYLRVRLRDWDETPSWLKGHSASVLERNLRAIEKDTRMEREETRILTEDEALEGVKALVVRGGPGAGKTWLSKRYARKAAQEALDRLEADVSLREVEIPLWTTFATWARCEPGPVKQRLAEASFDARLNLTTINATATDLVLRLFKECDLKVLAIVDSFDEATVNYRENYAGSLLRLAPDWRVVITSREGAWRENRREDLFDDLRTVDLQPLEWPVDMQAFVRRWFEPDAAQAEALLAQVEQRPDLRQMVTVPLLLAFICLIGQSEGDLPASRRDIYDRVVRRLLVEPWRQRDISQQNIEGCMKQLLKWAAQVAGQVDPVSGLGRWQDTIVTKPVKKDLRAVDNVAPVAFTDDEGNQTRRFIHRTVLEHLVAEWVASLSLKKAEAVLLPHLWFDSDWAYVTPAAIAAHPRRNVLLRSLLNKGQSRLNYPAHQGANFELGSLAVVLTQVSQPSDWPEKEQKYIAHTWFKCILRNPNKGVRAALPWA